MGATPMRVVSLLPSATEIVVAVGAGESLVGVSHSCDDPAVTHLPRLTRTRVPKGASSGEIDAVVRDCLGKGESLYTIDVETLGALEPDLIITQGLCDVCAVTEREVDGALCAVQVAPRVLSSEPRTVPQVLESITEIGECARAGGGGRRAGGGAPAPHRGGARADGIRVSTGRASPSSSGSTRPCAAATGTRSWWRWRAAWTASAARGRRAAPSGGRTS